MKGVFAFILLVACAQAVDFSKLKHKRVIAPVINPKYNGSYWDYIKSNQVIKPVVHPGYVKGTKPQPATSGISAVHSRHHSRIVGGNVASHGEFPWQALISIDDSYLCGGSLISENWVLTAGHCGYQFENFVVVLGCEDAYNADEQGREIYETTDVIVHENYDPVTVNNDICLINIEKSAVLTKYVNSILLPPKSMQSNPLVGDELTASGWGDTSDSSTDISEDLRYVSLDVITNQQCANTYGDIITPTKICTSTVGDHSTCSGDSGGPLMLQRSDGRFMTVGIVSFGDSAGCEKGYPDAFTRVTSYLDWISSKTDIKID